MARAPRRGLWITPFACLRCRVVCSQLALLELPMPTTIEALMVAIVGLVPGAAYVAAFDSQVGQGRSALPDRVIRYLTISAALHAVLAPATFVLWRVFADLQPRDIAPWLLWLPGLLYVAAPALLGAWQGRDTRRSDRGLVGRLAQLLAGLPRLQSWVASFETPASAASSWDQLFSRPHIGLIRARLRSNGTWVGGYWGQHTTRGLRGHASRFPDQGELLIPQVARLTRDGSFEVDDEGSVRLLDEAVLLRSDDVEAVHFEFVGEPTPDGPEGGDEQW
jgi:hypothetical protein